jgi:hypothetical protein
VNKVEEYRERADDAERLANRMPPGSEREALEKIAREWRRLAEQREAALKRGV